MAITMHSADRSGDIAAGHDEHRPIGLPGELDVPAAELPELALCHMDAMRLEQPGVPVRLDLTVVLADVGQVRAVLLAREPDVVRAGPELPAADDDPRPH